MAQMTFDEAKNILINRGFVEVNGHQIFDGDKWRNAIAIISKWLEQQPCEDCISREEALMALTGDITDCTIEEFIARLRAKLSKLPSVTPKEKTGKWIRWYETIEQEHCTIHDPHCKCSECNQEYDPYIASLFNYCPNCGAKM